MSEETPTINAQYHFSSRLKGEVELKIFNDFFLEVSQRHLKQQREFRIESAPLNPRAVKHEEWAYHWAAAAAITALGCGYFLSGLFTTDEVLMALLGAFIAATITALFVALFFYSSKHQWTLETRNALYPLIVIPYRVRQRKEAQDFVEKLQQAIEKNVEKKRYNEEDLFAGELRMLRRLAKHRILSDTLYDQAKAYMMKSHGQSAS